MANPFLIFGAVLSAVASGLHIGCVVFGPSWYRFFGAGERMVRLAAAGSPYATIATIGIAAVLASWSLYALSGAGIIPGLPLERVALCVITGIYLLRGLVGIMLAMVDRHPRRSAFWLWSSLICLVIGGTYLVGTRQAWFQLS